MYAYTLFVYCVVVVHVEQDVCTGMRRRRRRERERAARRNNGTRICRIYGRRLSRAIAGPAFFFQRKIDSRSRVYTLDTAAEIASVSRVHVDIIDSVVHYLRCAWPRLSLARTCITRGWPRKGCRRGATRARPSSDLRTNTREPFLFGIFDTTKNLIVVFCSFLLQIIYFYAPFAKEETIIQMLHPKSSSNEIHSNILSTIVVSTIRMIVIEVRGLIGTLSVVSDECFCVWK